MEKKRFDELTRLVERSIFHSELKDGYVVSGIHVNLPVNGNMTHLMNVERRVIAQTARDARMEEEASIRILSHQLAWVIEHAMELEKPVFQENEDGEQLQIGRSIILLDRNRIEFPQFVETKTEVYLNCVKEQNAQN